MSEYYVLRDVDNRDDQGEPWEIAFPTLTGFIGYVDGPLRDDVITPEGLEHVDAALEALRREWFPAAEKHLREVGVYLRLEHERRQP